MPPVTAEDETRTEWRPFTVPNLISLIRLACVPLFLYLLFGVDDRAAAAWLLAAIGVTDWVDGYVARRFDQVSELGKMLDPVADRVVLLVGVVAILIDGSVPVWFAVLTLVREGLVTIAVLVLGALGARRIDVTWWGKCATFGLLIAFPLFLAGASDLSWASTAEVLAYVAGIPGLIYGYLSLAQYVPLARAALSDGRATRP